MRQLALLLLRPSAISTVAQMVIAMPPCSSLAAPQQPRRSHPASKPVKRQSLPRGDINFAWRQPGLRVGLGLTYVGLYGTPL
jgi:hypothetical protein